MNNLNLIVLAALRYTLGRSSYMIDVIQDYIIENWSNPAIVNQQQVLREIKGFLECKPTTGYISATDKLVYTSWESFLDKLEKDC